MWFVNSFIDGLKKKKKTSAINWIIEAMLYLRWCSLWFWSLMSFSEYRQPFAGLNVATEFEPEFLNELWLYPKQLDFPEHRESKSVWEEKIKLKINLIQTMQIWCLELELKVNTWSVSYKPWSVLFHQTNNQFWIILIYFFRWYWS